MGKIIAILAGITSIIVAIFQISDRLANLKKSTRKKLTVILVFLVLLGMSAYYVINMSSNEQQGVAMEIKEAGWGPNRNTFTMEEPADYVTFNSIENNSVIGGDERDFVSIRKKGDNNYWKNAVKIEDGGEYYIRQYVHNNAASHHSLYATGVRSQFLVPVSVDNNQIVYGTIFSENAQPQRIWDGATFYSDQLFRLDYIEGSALIENNGFPSSKLSDNLVNTEEGVSLGYEKLDGIIPGCMQYSAYVTILVKARIILEETFFAKVSIKNDNMGKDGFWDDNASANKGDILSVKIEIDNIENLTERLNLRTSFYSLEYVPNSTVVIGESGTRTVSDSVITADGLNIELFGDSNKIIIEYKAKLQKNSTGGETPNVKNYIYINDLQKESVTYVFQR